jgi:hypothetical protein
MEPLSNSALPSTPPYRAAVMTEQFPGRPLDQAKDQHSHSNVSSQSPIGLPGKSVGALRPPRQSRKRLGNTLWIVLGLAFGCHLLECDPPIFLRWVLRAGDRGLDQVHSAASYSGAAPPPGTAIAPGLDPPVGAIAREVRSLQPDVRHLGEHGYERGPGNLDVAVQFFLSSYDRFPARPDSQLVDTITAAEAVLGSGIANSFKIAFRVAGMLGRMNA